MISREEIKNMTEQVIEIKESVKQLYRELSEMSVEDFIKLQNRLKEHYDKEV